MVKKPISSKGRRKIEMAKIPNESNLQVTFSKRRSGLFKKASELCTLCGVEIAIVVFSPAKKPFSFGHPAVDPIIDRFLTIKKNSSMKYPISDHYNNDSNNQMIFEPNLNSRSVIIHELNVKLTQLVSELEGEKKKAQVFEDQGKSQSQCWWESPVDELSLSELEVLKASLEELKNKVNMTREAHKIASDHQISTARFPHFSMMNGGQSADGVFYYKPMDDVVARNSASTLQEAHNFGFGNKIF